jgi:hypothetical protein
MTVYGPLPSLPAPLIFGDRVRLLTYIRPLGDLDHPRSGHDGLFARRFLIVSSGFSPVDIPRISRRRFDLFAIDQDARNRGDLSSFSSSGGRFKPPA